MSFLPDQSKASSNKPAGCGLLPIKSKGNPAQQCLHAARICSASTRPGGLLAPPPAGTLHALSAYTRHFTLSESKLQKRCNHRTVNYIAGDCNQQALCMHSNKPFADQQNEGFQASASLAELTVE